MCPLPIKTGIEALDEMLGGQGLPGGSVVLLRGGPGTGKTTLALQIMSKHLRSDVPGAYGIYVSLETNPDKTLQYLVQKFSRSFEKAFRIHSPTPNVVRAVSATNVPFVSLDRNAAIAGDLTGRTLAARIDAFVNAIDAKFNNDLLAGLMKQGFAENALSGLIVVDSLNLLGGALADTHEDARAVIYQACLRLQPLRERATVILLGEYNPEERSPQSVAAESFFCDVEIQLSSEAAVAKPATSPPRVTTGGGLSEGWQQPAPYEPEHRLFCRVIKCRSGASQTRRCSYDIVSDQGVKFYETYPADGRIMLYSENLREQEEWEYFFATDLSKLYPALQFDLFGRTGLQRTFASLRHFHDIPEKTDLYLASFDTYWISWYQELSERYDIARSLSTALPCGDDENDDQAQRRLFSRIVGLTQRRFDEWLPDLLAQPPLQALAADIEHGPCANCPRQCDIGRVERAARVCWGVLSKPGRQAGLTRQIPVKCLDLYGERRSPIIKELDANLRAKRILPVFIPPPVIDPPDPPDRVLAVPYNANVGMLVCREDLLTKLLQPDGPHSPTPPAVKEELCREVLAAHLRRTKALLTFLDSQPWRHFQEKLAGDDTQAALQFEGALRAQLAEVPRIEAEARRCVESLCERRLPGTWEEVIALCRLRTEKPYRFLIETQTFDTQLCTLLEWTWSMGGSLRVYPDYTIDKPAETLVRLFEALWLFHDMLQMDIIPKNATLEAPDFARLYGKSSAQPVGSTLPQDDWLFARHWYSTLVDVLTAKKKKEREEVFVWEPPISDMRLAIAPIPVGLAYQCSAAAVPHAACWGEWYFGCLKGSENLALAVDLINNLMSSRKICDRAFACAALPTVEEFYDRRTMYGDVKCFNMQARTDVQLPDITFAELKETFFATARSRSDVFDYRHSMRYLHAVLEFVHDFSGPQYPQFCAERLGERLVLAMDAINGLASKEILLQKGG